MKTGDFFDRPISAALCGTFQFCSVRAACEGSSNDGQTARFGAVGAIAPGGQGGVAGAGGCAIAPGGQGGVAGAGGCAIAPGGQGGFGSGSGATAPVRGRPDAGSGATAPVSGQPDAGSGAGEQTDACALHPIEVPPPGCAGTSGYEFAVCYQIANGELSATCQGLCGEDVDTHKQG